MEFYGIHVPRRPDDGNAEESPVFNDKIEALKFLRKYKDARFKAFSSHEDALNFAKHGFENAIPIKPKVSTTIGLEKPLFRAPKSQELVQFRKLIEQGKAQLVSETIWDNPRFLVGSGDTPTILKESARYNAVHVAVLAKNAEMCQLLLSTISKPTFVEVLHGKDDPTISAEVNNVLLDLYLNMPEKGRSETPLHLAVKNGLVDVVEVLASYSGCKMLPNNEGLLPKDIICMRVKDPDPKVVERIAALLEERFYVPVIRSLDNSLPPMIGEPFSPSNMPELRTDPLSPEMAIQAFAGPMNKEQAQSFRKRWKTPPRLVKSPVNSFSSSPVSGSPVSTRRGDLYNNVSSTPIKNSAPRQLFADNDKDVNENESDLNGSMDSHNSSTSNLKQRFNKFLKLKEYLPNFSGDKSLEESPKKSVSFSDYSELDDSIVSPSYQERHVKLTNTEKGLEVIGRNLAKQQNIGWNEYWQFLGGFANLMSPEGMLKLEKYLQERDERFRTELESNMFVMNLCSVLENLDFQTKQMKYKLKREKEMKSNGITPPISSPVLPKTITWEPPIAVDARANENAYQCAEKSCQVFARRMANVMIHNSKNIIGVNDSISAELQRLKSMIQSYKVDERFSNVDFDLVHSRISHLVINFLHADLDNNNEKFIQIKNSIESILKARQKNYVNVQGNKTSHTECFLTFVLRYFHNVDLENLLLSNNTEIACMTAWTKEKRCDCIWDIADSLKSRQMKRRQPSNTDIKNTSSQTQIENNNKPDEAQLWNYREPKRETSVESDDERYYSANDDTDDEFYTPINSPGEMNEKYMKENDLGAFRNFILGDEPSKTDVDVFHVLEDADIPKEEFPHIFKWREAVMYALRNDELSFSTVGLRTGSFKIADVSNSFSSKIAL